MSKCNFCKNEFSFDDFIHDIEFSTIQSYIGEIVDSFGVDALEEADQAVYEELICLKCYLNGVF